MLVNTSKTIHPNEVKEKLANGEKVNILDVREDEEWISGHIPGAKHIPLGKIMERSGELEKGKPIIVVCRSGGRSSRACEYLNNSGIDAINMTGGMNNWEGALKYGPSSH